MKTFKKLCRLWWMSLVKEEIGAPKRSWTFSQEQQPFNLKVGLKMLKLRARFLWRRSTSIEIQTLRFSNFLAAKGPWSESILTMVIMNHHRVCKIKCSKAKKYPPLRTCQITISKISTPTSFLKTRISFPNLKAKLLILLTFNQSNKTPSK